MIPFTHDLKVTSSGTDVTTLQNWLLSQGYSIPAGATGHFGIQTKAALKAFQSAKHIPATGYFGSITRAAIHSN
jgi:peptidoglycan hydrolase-like protein with peptidoglycan-binding domain